MAEQQDDFAVEDTPGYKAPNVKSVDEILELDQEDESLKKYKAQLLGAAKVAGSAPSDDPRRVIVMKLMIKVQDRSDIEIDLGGDLKKLKDNAVVIKEGCKYKIVIQFRVQHEIVTGLKYVHVVYRKGIRVDKDSVMVGSYAPKPEPHEAVLLEEEAPKGMLQRGSYTVKSQFTDDDKNKHLQWEWAIDIKKDWD